MSDWISSVSGDGRGAPLRKDELQREPMQQLDEYVLGRDLQNLAHEVEQQAIPDGKETEASLSKLERKELLGKLHTVVDRLSDYANKLEGRTPYNLTSPELDEKDFTFAIFARDGHVYMQIEKVANVTSLDGNVYRIEHTNGKVRILLLGNGFDGFAVGCTPMELRNLIGW